MWNGEKAGERRDVQCWITPVPHAFWLNPLYIQHIHTLYVIMVKTQQQYSGHNQRQSTLVLISFLSSYIFVLIASCIFTMHLFSVLPCLVKILEKHYLYYSDNILWSVFLLISVLCSNIFSHAAIGQCMRHKKEMTGVFFKRIICYFVCKTSEESN